jgi:hypothetical protein
MVAVAAAGAPPPDVHATNARVDSNTIKIVKGFVFIISTSLLKRTFSIIAQFRAGSQPHYS